MWSERGLQRMMFSVNDCPQCHKNDNEIITVKEERSTSNYFICNICGHRWGLGYLKEE